MCNSFLTVKLHGHFVSCNLQPATICVKISLCKANFKSGCFTYCYSDRDVFYSCYCKRLADCGTLTVLETPHTPHTAPWPGPSWGICVLDPVTLTWAQCPTSQDRHSLTHSLSLSLSLSLSFTLSQTFTHSMTHGTPERQVDKNIVGPVLRYQSFATLTAWYRQCWWRQVVWYGSAGVCMCVCVCVLSMSECIASVPADQQGSAVTARC